MVMVRLSNLCSPLRHWFQNPFLLSTLYVSSLQRNLLVQHLLPLQQETHDVEETNFRIKIKINAILIHHLILLFNWILHRIKDIIMQFYGSKLWPHLFATFFTWWCNPSVNNLQTLISLIRLCCSRWFCVTRNHWLCIIFCDMYRFRCSIGSSFCIRFDVRLCNILNFHLHCSICFNTMICNFTLLL